MCEGSGDTLMRKLKVSPNVTECCWRKCGVVTQIKRLLPLVGTNVHSNVHANLAIHFPDIQINTWMETIA